MSRSLPALLLVLALAAPASLGGTESWLDGYSAYRAGDYKKAFPAFSAAAAQGDAKAMNYLGQMHASGHGTPRGIEAAARWFRLAAAVPESLRRLVGACLKPEPKNRPQSMRVVDEMLLESAR